MRDGVKLHGGDSAAKGVGDAWREAAIFDGRGLRMGTDGSTSDEFRECDEAGAGGRAGYIFVYGDIRGRYESAKGNL